MSLINDATTAANVGTGGFIIGLTALAAGAWLVIQPLRSSAPASSTASPAKTSARLAPYLAQDRGGLAVEGEW
jgi:hypothetical protein